MHFMFWRKKKFSVLNIFCYLRNTASSFIQEIVWNDQSFLLNDVSIIIKICKVIVIIDQISSIWTKSLLIAVLHVMPLLRPEFEKPSVLKEKINMFTGSPEIPC
jgi:hypothetical protein